MGIYLHILIHKQVSQTDTDNSRCILLQGKYKSLDSNSHEVMDHATLTLQYFLLMPLNWHKSAFHIVFCLISSDYFSYSFAFNHFFFK